MCSGCTWSLLFLLPTLPWAQQPGPCICCNGLYICRVSYFNHRGSSRNWWFKMKSKLESGYRVCMRKHIWVPVEKVLGSRRLTSLRSLSFRQECSGAFHALAKWFFSRGRIRDIRFEEIFHNSSIIHDSSLEILMRHKWCIWLWWGRSTITSLNVTRLFIHGNKVFVIINVSCYLAIKSVWNMTRRCTFVRLSATVLCGRRKWVLRVSPFIPCRHLILFLTQSLSLLH